MARIEAGCINGSDATPEGMLDVAEFRRDRVSNLTLNTLLMIERTAKVLKGMGVSLETMHRELIQKYAWPAEKEYFAAGDRVREARLLATNVDPSGLMVGFRNHGVE